MICYICEGEGKESNASFQCPDCKRYVCGKHTKRWEEIYYCSRCAETREEESKKRKAEARKTEAEQQKEKIKWRNCELCGQVTDLNGLATVGTCGMCGKRFCDNCGWFKRIGYERYKYEDHADGVEYIKIPVVEARCNRCANFLWRIGAYRVR